MSYAVRTFALIQECPVVPGTRWLTENRASGRFAMGGPGWCSFAAFSGEPVTAVGRVDSQVDPMSAMAADVQGNWIATGDANGFVRIFLGTTLERVDMVGVGNPVDTIRFSPDGSTIAVVSRGLKSRRLHIFRLVQPR